LDQATLPQPEIALAGEQALAQNHWVEAQREMFDEMPALREQHFLDEVRMIDEVNAVRPKADGRHIAVFAGATLHKPEAIPRKVAQMAGEPAPGRAGRQRCGHDRVSSSLKSPRLMHGMRCLRLDIVTRKRLRRKRSWPGGQHESRTSCSWSG